MGSQKSLNPVIKDGVQVIVLFGVGQKIIDPYQMKFLLIQDYNDRGRGDEVKLWGLPGGGIDEGEVPSKAAARELYEEAGLCIDGFSKEGVFSKLRSNGLVNQNYLFSLSLGCEPKLNTNDPLEVSRVKFFTLSEILNFAKEKQIHEGSIRLILLFLKGEKTSSLNEPVVWEKNIF